jgi:hypothetical protein
MSDVVLERIDGWEAAGLIDGATADRLRSAEQTIEPTLGNEAAGSRPGLVSSFFGPSASIVEAFSYLGGAFLLAAWTALIARLMGEAVGQTRDWITVAGFAIPAVVFFAIGMFLHGRSPRLSRAAGVAFVLSVGLIQGGVTVNVHIFTDGALPVFAGAVAGLVAASAYRWFHPSVLTEFALLATITGVAASSLELLDQVIFAEPTELGAYVVRGLSGVALEAIAWLVCAIVIGLIALAEARGAGDAAARRAALARFWAGVVAVAGVATAVMSTECSDVGCARVIEPWIADVTVLVVSAVLIERAFRRGSGAYVLAAALGVVIALTDFNVTYFAPSTGNEVALFAEGLLLIAIAIVAERLSRRIVRRRHGDRVTGGTSQPGEASGPPETNPGPEAASG